MAARCNEAQYVPIKAENLPSLISVEECSRLIHMAQVTVRKKCREGEIVASKIGRDWLINKAKLLERFDMS